MRLTLTLDSQTTDVHYVSEIHIQDSSSMILMYSLSTSEDEKAPAVDQHDLGIVLTQSALSDWIPVYNRLFITRLK